MKNFTFYFLFIFIVQFASSQTNKSISGKVIFRKNPIRDVEVINWDKKTITKSDSDGNFTIVVSENDSLFFLSKNHLDKKTSINKTNYETANIVIALIEKTIDLEEIKIIKNQSTGLKVTQQDIDGTILEKKEARPENKEVDMGTINQGMDFVRIFKDLKKLLKNKSDKNERKTIAFTKYVGSNFETEYFVKNLELKPDEINKFIAFCNEDIEAPRLAELSNILTMMDFLHKKNIEFKNL